MCTRVWCVRYVGGIVRGCRWHAAFVEAWTLEVRAEPLIDQRPAMQISCQTDNEDSRASLP